MKRERWTNEDESLLQRLMQRKNDLVTINRQPVLALVMVNNMFDATSEEIVDILIDNADAFRDALEPFDSGIRCASEAA